MATDVKMNVVPFFPDRNDILMTDPTAYVSTGTLDWGATYPSLLLAEVAGLSMAVEPIDSTASAAAPQVFSFEAIVPAALAPPGAPEAFGAPFKPKKELIEHVQLPDPVIAEFRLDAPWWVGPTRQPFPPGLVSAVYPDRLDAQAAQQPSGADYPLQPPVVVVTVYPLTPTLSDQFGALRLIDAPWWTGPDRQPFPSGRASAVYPDRIDRPTVPPDAQRPWFGPDRQPFPPGRAGAVYPDRLIRPEVPADAQDAFFGVDRQPVPALWTVLYPDEVRAPARLVVYPAWTGADRQPFPSGRASVVYPDRVDRPSYDVSEQRAFFSAERQPLPSGRASAVYPDRIDRPVVPADAQDAFFSADRQSVPPTNEWVDFELPLPLAPLHLQRDAWFGPARQPFPPGRSSVVYPDRLIRPEVPADQQRAFFSADRQPLPSGRASAIYPDRIDRFFVTADEQDAFFGVDRQPLPPGRASAVYPDRIDRIVVTPDEQRAFFSADRQPLPPGRASAVYPDRIDRSVVPADAQRPWFGPERQPLPSGRASVVYPDRIVRPEVLADEQRAFFEPERQPDPPFNEWIDFDLPLPGIVPPPAHHAFFGVDQHPFVLTPGPFAYYPDQLYCWTVTPDEQQPFFALVTPDEPTGTWYPTYIAFNSRRKIIVSSGS